MVNPQTIAPPAEMPPDQMLPGMTPAVQANARDLGMEIEWFRTILKTRSAINSGGDIPFQDVFEVLPPALGESQSDYAKLTRQHSLDFSDRFLLMLGLVPHVKPELLDLFIVQNENTKQLYTEFGGRLGKDHSGFLPTGETAMFILAGSDLSRRFALQHKFSGDHYLYTNRLVWLAEVAEGEPRLTGQLLIADEVLDLLMTGVYQKPRYSGKFPAKLLDTNMTWADLILAGETMARLQDIDTWLQQHHTLMQDWGMSKRLKPGYKALFYGPPGTGKSLTAALLGKRTGQDVYRIDLSQVVSKYIGETEKNLARVFDQAEGKGWILFFDEAEALFGKRSSISDSHDRYANQEVAYLLQRIEDYNGLVILASNLKSNLDDAFYRRFQSVIHFPMPAAAERLRLWQQSFSDKAAFAPDVDFAKLAHDYALSGGPILNVVHYASLQALQRGNGIVQQRDLIEGIRREYHKNEKTL